MVENNKLHQSLLVGILMMLAAYLGFKLQPNNLVLSKSDNFILEKEIPISFNKWHVDNTILPVKVDPEVQANIDKTYDQVLTRTYKNSHGDAVMLSIAYGKKQSKSLQVHKPETCYSAQGFFVKSLGNYSFDIASNHLKVRRLIATNGQRVEPITYWIRVGDSLEFGGINQTIKRVRLGLSGVVADGLLFRVSTLDSDISHSFEVQHEFINDLLLSISSESKEFLVGKR